MFEERERAFEAKYAYDEEFRFRVTARRDKLFARWAAEQLHLPEHDAADLTRKVLGVKDGAGHDERLLDLARQTYLAHGIKDPAGLLSALYQCAEKARLDLLDHHVSLILGSMQLDTGRLESESGGGGIGR